MSQNMDTMRLQNRIRLWVAIFMLGLIVSGLTAVALPAETEILHGIFGSGSATSELWPELSRWIDLVHRGVHETNERYPFILYGDDWLAFGHIVIAIAFLGVLRDPMRNVWVIQFGMIACVLVVPWACVFGPMRGIPLLWGLVDGSFGVLGLVPLSLAYRNIRRLGGKEEGRSSDSTVRDPP